MLANMVPRGLTFCGIAMLFSEGPHFMFPSPVYEGSHFSPPSLTLNHYSLVDMKRCFTVALICVSLKTTDVEHFSICRSSLEKCLFR